MSLLFHALIEVTFDQQREDDLRYGLVPDDYTHLHDQRFGREDRENELAGAIPCSPGRTGDRNTRVFSPPARSPDNAPPPTAQASSPPDGAGHNSHSGA